MAYTDAQKNAILKYLAENTDDVRLRVPKGTKERWKAYAEKADKSMTGYVRDAVEVQIQYDDTGEHEVDSHLIVNLIKWLEVHGHSHTEILDCLMALSVKPDTM